MHLADDGVARQAVAELRRDLAGALAVEPELTEQFHSFIRPRHRWPRFLVSVGRGKEPTFRRSILLRAESGSHACPAALASVTHRNALVKVVPRHLVVRWLEITLVVESRARVAAGRRAGFSPGLIL